MYLFKAKQVAQQELEEALRKTNLTIDQVREFLAEHPRFANALHRAPHSAGSTPADLVYEVAEYVHTTSAQRLWRTARAAAQGFGAWARGAALGAPTTTKQTLAAGQQLAAELAEIAKDHGPALVEKVVRKGVEQARATLDRTKLAEVLPIKGRPASELRQAS